MRTPLGTGGKTRVLAGLALSLLALTAVLTYNTLLTQVRAGPASEEATVTVPELLIEGLAGEELVLPGQQTAPSADLAGLLSLLLTTEGLLAAAAATAALAAFASVLPADPGRERGDGRAPGLLRRTTRVREHRSRARPVAAAGSRGESGSHRGDSESQRGQAATAVARGTLRGSTLPGAGWRPGPRVEFRGRRAR